MADGVKGAVALRMILRAAAFFMERDVCHEDVSGDTFQGVIFPIITRTGL